MPRPPSHLKADKFRLPKDKKTPTVFTPPPTISLPLFDFEAAYVIGALIDAQERAASQEGEVFQQKAKALSLIAARIAKAFRERK
jgi:hypothetical protein